MYCLMEGTLSPNKQWMTITVGLRMVPMSIFCTEPSPPSVLNWNCFLVSCNRKNSY